MFSPLLHESIVSNKHFTECFSFHRFGTNVKIIWVQKRYPAACRTLETTDSYQHTKQTLLVVEHKLWCGMSYVRLWSRTCSEQYRRTVWWLRKVKLNFSITVYTNNVKITWGKVWVEQSSKLIGGLVTICHGKERLEAKGNSLSLTTDLCSNPDLRTVNYG